MIFKIIQFKIIYVISLLLLIAQCSFGIEGNETIRAREAADILRRAMASRFTHCLVGQELTTSDFFQPPFCVSPADPDLLVRATDVDACAQLLLYVPCIRPAFGMSLVMTTVATSCPIETVPFLFNRVNHPFQGNILSMNPNSTSDGRGRPAPLYFGCY